MAPAKERPATKTIATNREARHEYFVLEALETGVELKGTEVKSLRAGGVNLKDSWVDIEDGELLVTLLSRSMSTNSRPRRKLYFTYLTTFSILPLLWGSDLRQNTGSKPCSRTRVRKTRVSTRSPRFSLTRNILSWS